MANISLHMGLRLWNQLQDPYDHAQLTDNFSKLDLHDHTPSRGVQIPTEGIADGAITTAKLNSAVDFGGYTTYRLLAERSHTDAAGANAIYALGWNAAFASTVVESPVVFHLDSSDFPASGSRTPKLVLRSRLATMSTAPGVNVTVDVRPVTGFAGAAGTNPRGSTGTAVTGSAVTFSGTEVSSATVTTTKKTSSFSFPTPGDYAICLSYASAPAAGSRQGIWSALYLVQE